MWPNRRDHDQQATPIDFFSPIATGEPREQQQQLQSHLRSGSSQSSRSRRSNRDHSSLSSSKSDSKSSSSHTKRSSVAKRLPFEQADLNLPPHDIGEPYRHSSGSSLYLDIPNTSDHQYGINDVNSSASSSHRCQSSTHQKSVTFSSSTRDNASQVNEPDDAP